MKWYRKAANQGDASAQCHLGYCYKNGQGVRQDDAEAVKWYRKAANQGHAAAQFNLGNCYYKGQGVRQDYAEAVKLYREAANQGRKEAIDVLIHCYENGIGVEQDVQQAQVWRQKKEELSIIQPILPYSPAIAPLPEEDEKSSRQKNIEIILKMLKKK